jgi:phage terminase large subunit GpA-like protein
VGADRAAYWKADQERWLAEQFESLTTEIVVSSPSEWAERCRYLPPSNSNMPGYYRFSVVPYLREIVDCMSVDSPVRHVALMKGVQLGGTTGVLENSIGYYIEQVKTAPMMMVTANDGLAKTRLDQFILPMINASGQGHLISSTDEGNERKTGKTAKKLEFVGGGFLVITGCQNPDALISLPIRVLMRDEIDTFPRDSKAGDSMKISYGRTKAYEDSRKVLDISAPTLKGDSNIEGEFLLGDQRHYFFCCLSCGHPQVFSAHRSDAEFGLTRWRQVDKRTGVCSGFVWELHPDTGQLIPGSTRFLCHKCGHAHTNEDKTRLLDPANGAEWRPTAVPASPDRRSYHLPAFLSPVGMQSWDACVQDFLEAWDPARNIAKDVTKLQVFYNSVLAETFEVTGDKVLFRQVSPHKRGFYRFGEIPNRWANEHAGSRVLVVVCTVDVHKTNLAVGVWGWCRGTRPFLIEYRRLEGDTEQLDDPGTWLELAKLLETQEYLADDGKRYRIEFCLIDSGYRTDTVYRFCEQYPASVYPVKGREDSGRATAARHFTEFHTPLGKLAFGVTVDFYKDRWAGALRRGYDKSGGLQPETTLNLPSDTTDDQLKELVAEKKVEKRDARGNVTFEWHRPNGAPNELWDLLVYANAALDILANAVSRDAGFDQVEWEFFWTACERGRFFYE